MDNAELVVRDLRAVWHPCTQMKDHEQLPLIPIRRGEGVWLEDFDGNRYIDAISSWWVNLFGHGNPHIRLRIQQQLAVLEHVILAGFTHEPAVTLSEKLVAVTPARLTRCFYAENGSSAVEIALKMSFHYWKNQGLAGKTEFVNLHNSYHGETLGALSVGDVELYKKTYAPLLLRARTVASPDAYHREAGESEADYAVRQFGHMESTLAQRGDRICAVIVEPLVQCAGSMRMYDPVYLELLRDACDRYRVHLIADECAVGFGRTGSMFACEQASVEPDFLCLAKGLTGGFLPLSAVLTSERVFDAFYDDYETLKGFLHSHSYTGNPLACAAAIGSLELFEQSDVIAEIQRLAGILRRTTEHIREHPHVGDVRQRGMILAIELVKDRGSREAYDWRERRGLEVYRYGLKHQALLRPLGNVVYFMPPYVINDEELTQLADVAWRGIQLATTRP